MKILTVVHSLGKGGTERAAVNFAVSYMCNGHDSRLLYTDRSGPREIECKANSIQVYCFLDMAMLQALQSWEPDIIHLHSHGLKSFQVEFLSSMCPSAEIIETNVFSRPSAWEHLLTKSYQLSNWCLWLYCQRGGDLRKAAVVPNPVNCSNFYSAPEDHIKAFRSKHGISLDCFLMGRIGQAYDGKWSPIIVRVFEKVLRYRPDSQLLLVNAPDSIVNLAKASPASSRITIISQLASDEELRLAYSSIDIFLHSASQGESFGMVLAESLLCETPVITLATPWGDNSQLEVSPNRICGFCVDSEKSYHQVLKTLIVDDSLRLKLGRQGRSHILRKYNSNDVAASAINSVALGFSSNLLQPSALYDLENKPNMLTMFMIDRYACRHLIYYACNPTLVNISRLFRYGLVLFLKTVWRAVLMGVRQVRGSALRLARSLRLA